MRRKSPQTKKAEAYEHERRGRAWSSDKADRRNRPLAKAIARRSARRIVRQVAHVTPGPLDPERLETMDSRAAVAAIKAAREPEPYTSGSVPLAEWVKGGAQRKVDRAGWNYFRAMRYDAPNHREAFAAFLQNVLSGGTADSARLARLFHEVLHVPDGRGCATGERARKWLSYRTPWLRAFLEDAPEWKQPLDAWIRRHHCRRRE